jgi:hypothetical protein
MSYDPVITPRAAEDLAALPLPVQNFLELQINRLAEAPSQLSRPAVFPYPTLSEWRNRRRQSDTHEEPGE